MTRIFTSPNESKHEMKYQSRNDDDLVSCSVIRFWLIKTFAHKNVFDTIRNILLYTRRLVKFDTYTLDLITDKDPIHFRIFSENKMSTDKLGRNTNENWINKSKNETKIFEPNWKWENVNFFHLLRDAENIWNILFREFWLTEHLKYINL